MQLGPQGQQAVEIGPSHQLAQVAVVVERRLTDDLHRLQGAVVEIPTGPVQTARRHLDQAQVGLVQIGGDLQIDALHLTGQRLEGGVELARQDADIFRVDRLADVIAAGKLDQLAVALHQGIEQLTIGLFDLSHLPVVAIIQMVQPLPIPTPLRHQPRNQLASAAAMGRIALRPEIVTHLQIETASGQIQPFEITNAAQVVRHLVEHQVIGIQLQAVIIVLLEPVARLIGEQPGLRKLGGVGLHQQDLQHRLVGRIEPLVEQPERRAEVLLGGNALQAAEIQPLLWLQPPGGEEFGHLLVILLIPLAGQDGPQQALSGNAQGAAIELVEQQQVLGAAAVVATELRMIVETELVVGDQEEVELDTAILGQLGDQQTLLLQ